VRYKELLYSQQIGTRSKSTARWLQEKGSLTDSPIKDDSWLLSLRVYASPLAVRQVTYAILERIPVPLIRLSTLCALLTCTLLFASCDAGGSSIGVDSEDPPPPPDDGGSNTASIQITAEANGEEVQLQWSGSNLDQAVAYRLYRGGQPTSNHRTS